MSLSPHLGYFAYRILPALGKSKRDLAGGQVWVRVGVGVGVGASTDILVASKVARGTDSHSPKPRRLQSYGTFTLTLTLTLLPLQPLSTFRDAVEDSLVVPLSSRACSVRGSWGRETSWSGICGRPSWAQRPPSFSSLDMANGSSPLPLAYFEP